MGPDFIKRLLTAILLICSLATFGQMPASPCGPSGGKRADLLGMDVKYSAPGASAPVFQIPAGTKSISIYISSETGITSGGRDYAQGDEDFITISAVIDIASNTSSGYVNYAKSTHVNGSGTNVYGWQNVPLGAFIPAASKVGDATPDLNNVNFSIAGNTLTIAQSATGMHSSFYVQYLSPFNNSLYLLQPQAKALLHGETSASTDLLLPIPADADIIFISGKGTNSSYADLNTSDGTEEGYANLRFTIDLNKGTTNGFVTLANGGSANRRSTYVVNDLASTYSGQLVGSGAVDGDYNGKSTNVGAVGLYNPRIYVSGNNLVIKRDAHYARDFDDAYAVEFYKRAGQGMSAEFVNSDIRSVPKGQSSTSGVTRTFTIPPGTNAIYFNETGNAVNVDRESNENSLEAYAYIDLTTETAAGYFYQQVGLSLTERRDDNFAFKGVPLDNSSVRNHPNTVGFKGRYNYDISFSLSADKSQLTVTNKTGLANPDYQILLSADYYGSKPDIAFNASAISFSKVDQQKTVQADLAVCNPGSGNSNGGMPVAFYHGNPTVDPSAKLLYVGTFNDEIRAGECKNFSFDIDLSSFTDLNIDLSIVINDDGSFVAGGVGHTIGTPFSLTALPGQHATYQECYYENNIVTKRITVNNAPELDPDPDNSSGATGAFTYLNYFTAGSTTGARIADADLSIVDPDASTLSAATVTLTNVLNAGSEGLYLEGALPAGITIAGNGTNVVTLTGQAPQSDYIAALKMLEYRNSKGSPQTANRIVTVVLNDGIEPGPVSTTTIVILTEPRITVTGNGVNIADNSTAVSTADGTDFGRPGAAAIAHTFSIANTGTGTLHLTGSPAVGISGDGGFTISAQPADVSLSSAANTDLTVRFDPAGHAAGAYTAVVRITNNDADAGRSDYTFTVAAVINALPAGTGDTRTTPEDVPVDGVVTGSDGDNDPLTFTKASDPANGTVDLKADGSYTYTPNAGYSGADNFSVTISDGHGGNITVPVNITVTPVNDIPTGTGDTKITPEEVPVDGAVTGADADNDPLSYTKASDPANGTVDVKSDGSYTYTPNADYTGSDNFTVTISDGQGGSITVPVNITVMPVNDIPTGTGDTRTTPEDVPVDGAVTGSDVDNDPLTFTKASDPNNGTVDVKSDGSYTYKPNAGYNGPDYFTIAISDGQGGNITAAVIINVIPVNDIPTGTGDAKTTPEEVPVSGAVTGADADNDPLTFVKASDPANGVVDVKSDGTYTYTPNANYTGADNFTITISDGQGGSATVSVNITVTPVNDLPTGAGDSKTTPEDVPVDGSVTGSDADNDPLTFAKASDPTNGTVDVKSDGTYTYTPNVNYTGTDNFTITISDGQGGSATVPVNITVTPVNDLPTGAGDSKTTPEDVPVSGAVTGSDADNDQLTFAKASNPTNGTVDVKSDGNYTYTPNANYTGADNFTITISDGQGGSATVSVNITVTPVNDIPTGTGDAKTTPEDVPVDGAVTGSDADNDPLTFAKASNPTNGTVDVRRDGGYTYTPNANYTGADIFTITISDGQGGSATVSVNITVTPVNDIPTGTGDTKTTPEDVSVDGAVTGSDADNDPLTFTKASSPAHGTATVHADGSYTYTPNANYTGADNFTITISDGQGGSATVSVNITVTPVNDIPTGTGDTKTTPEDVPVDGAVTGSDADNDPLTFAKASDPTNGTATVHADGNYTYTPNANYTGADNFTITISDGQGGSATVSVNITVTPVNDIPTGTGDAKTTPEDVPVDGAVTGSDADNDPLTFAKASDPTNGTVDVKSDGTYTYTPNVNYTGTDNFTITISDGQGGSATVPVNITVTPVNDIPTGTGDTKTTPEDVPVDGVVTGSDEDNDQLTFAKASDPTNGTVDVKSDGTYTYTPNANYTGADNFTITISDGQGGSIAVPVNITVTPVNDIPTGTGDTKTTPEDVPVDGVVTGSDEDNDQLTFAKASNPTNGTVDVRRDGGYTYTPSANYTGADIFTITISDGQGGSATVSVNITVTPVNDIPTGTGDTKTTPEDVPVDGAVTGADADNDPLSYTKASDPANGTVDVKSDGNYTYTPNANYTGADNFTITISDGQGGAITVTVNITVTPVNDIPTGTGDTKTTPEDVPVDGSVTGSDADNDPLTFTKASDPTNGTVDVKSDGTYTYTPNANYTGADNFTITISDRQGSSITVAVNITVTPVNDIPTGTGDTKTTLEDVPVSGAVTGSDADNDPLTFTKASNPTNGTVDVKSDGGYTYTPNANYTGSDNFTIIISDGQGGSITVPVNITVTPVNDIPTGTGDTKTTPEDVPVDGAVTGSDADNDQLTFAKGSNPTNGTVDVKSDGNYTYTPNANYTGADNFTITISDGQGGSATVSVNITVTPVNDIPTGTGDTKTTPEDVPVDGAVTGSDADNDQLTFAKASDPTNGTVDVKSDGTYTYTPNANYTGADNFTITISDGQGGGITVPVNITVTPVNDIPTGTGDTKTTPEDVPVDGAVTGSDADNDPLTFTRASSPAHGTATVHADGSYTYTPNANYNGPDNFTVAISDGKGGSITVTVNINVTPVNDAPTGRGDSKITPEDTPVSGAVTGKSADGITLTFTRASDPGHGAVIVHADGSYTYTPDANYNGPDNFSITISGSKGNSTTVAVNITVTPVNDIPRGTGDAKATPENTPVQGAVSGSDPDGDALAFSKATDPTNGAVTVRPDGSYTYIPQANYSGPDNFSITISDGNGGSITVPVDITVIPAAVTAGISLVKSAVLRSDNVSITYLLVITNTGNAVLHNVTVTDPMLGLNKTLPADLQPGASATVTAVYRITQEDRDNGRVTNTAVVKALTPTNQEVTDTSGTSTDNDNPTATKVSKPPHASNDQADTRTATPVTIPVLDNDDPAQSSFNTGSITIIAQPAHGRLILHLDGTITYTPDNGYTGEDGFTYRVRDVDGYMTNVAVVKLIVAAGDVRIPTLFTPNGDGKNDVFEIRGLHMYAENELVIVNRWGNEVYRQKNYQNSWKGDGLNEGTYYYLLRLKKHDGSGWEVLKGYTTLVRKFKQ